MQNTRELLARAVDPVVAIVEGIKPDQLGLPTPCSDYDVRGLINHFAGTTNWLEQLGRGSAPDTADPSSLDVDVTTGDWQALLAARIRTVATVWAEPSAWEGSIEGIPLPPIMIGNMALTELLMHGWDLAKATGQQVNYDDDIAHEAYQFATETAAMGQQMGAYGAEVAVSAQAPAFDRALGLTGRDPAWTP